MEELLNLLSPFGNDFGFSMKTFNDYADLVLYPQELELLGSKVVQKRRIEFCLGRGAAHIALKKIGLCNYPILKGIHNEPLWPKGVVGSISHCDEIALAAVALKEKSSGIGLDIERKDNNVEGIKSEVCTIRELDWVNGGNKQSSERIIMVFSAKESAFKALFPINGVFLNFLDAELIWDENKKSFSGRLLKSAGLYYGEGYIFEVGCKENENYIFTFISLPPFVSF